MTNNSQILGKSGEKRAKQHLLTLGYSILETNWRHGKYEIDIIASNANTIVFVEVKTRKSDTFGEPEVFVDKKKQNFLVAAAHHYLVANNINHEARFDIIAILETNGKSTLNHLEGAFSPGIKKI